MTNIVDFKTKKTQSFQPFIFIDTLFERKREMLFAMALLENQREIRVTQATIDAPTENQLVTLGEIIRVHFKTTNGQLPIWGQIHCYKFFITPDSALIFDIHGHFVQTINEELP
jgi:hypothetical protein